MSNWPAWLIVSGLFSFVPINAIADIADFSTRYLEENPEGKFLRAKIRKQVANTLNAVSETGRYHKVTILAHSFGVVIATDLVADYHQNYRISYISLGGCLEFIAYKNQQIKKEIIKSLNNKQIDKWIDFYSEQDWLCTKTPIPKDADLMRLCHRKIQLPFSLLNQLSGQSHEHYFTNEQVLKAALNLED